MSDVCMVFGEDGNAFDAFPFEPDELEAVALQLRRERGEVTTVTTGPSPFVVMSHTGVAARVLGEAGDADA